ncbi:MAG: glycerophosphoryl diester phosphodiesterase membrane domain-containing protein, partial [Nanoarchaeota archaeon]|nr:glycerophosphoryl diester phosphodiesterase membrane domain-containing protein [Nanoarchaeota archaeon]
GLRLFFVTPAMYIDQKNAVSSIKHSFQITKGHIWQVVIIFSIIWGISIFLNSFVGQPLSGTYSNVMFGSNWIKISINFILVLFFVILQSFVFTFEHIFLFYSYIDFKKLRRL